MTNKFEDLQYEGAKQFGGDWLTANRVAVSLLRDAGLNLKEYRVLGSMIALRICQHGSAQAHTEKEGAGE